MIRHFIILYFLVFFITTKAFASPESFFRNNMPPGVNLGMSPTQLASTRPEAFKNTFIETRRSETETFTMTEIVRQDNSGTVFWYWFRNGILGAVSRSISFKNISYNSALDISCDTYNNLQTSFTFHQNDNAVRSTGGKSYVLTAQLWKCNLDNKSVYYIASSHENTMIIFDPNSFCSSDFFLPIDKLNELNIHSEKIRSIVNDAIPEPPLVSDFIPIIIERAANKTFEATNKANPAIHTENSNIKSSATLTKIQTNMPSIFTPWLIIVAGIPAAIGSFWFYLKRRPKK